MNRRMLLGGIAGLAGCAAAAYVARPIVAPAIWKWRSGMRSARVFDTSLAYRDSGEGRPAVVFANGVSVSMENYYDLQQRLDDVTRVVTFDRPGMGDSTPNPEPPTLDYMDKDLRELLRVLDVPPPYVLVGHSMGGHIIRYFAHHHPGEVAGLVFLDHPHEDWFRYIRATWSEQEVREYFDWWTPKPGEPLTPALEERFAYERNCDMVRGIAIPPDIPVLMFTADNKGHFRKSPDGQAADRRMWVEMQASLLTGVKDARHLVNLELSHMLHRDRPEWVAAEVTAFIQKLRQPAAQSGVSRRSPAPPAAAATATATAVP